LIPRLLNREREILSCLSATELRQFENALAKIEKSFELTQTDAPPAASKDHEQA